MPRNDDEFTTAARAVADERYGGEFDRGFAHLSLQLAFPTYEFTDDQAEEIIGIDRAGDLGADGLNIDDDERRILLFQAKSSAKLGEPELHAAISAFIGTPAKLLSPEWLAKAHKELRALANDFKGCVADGYDLVYAFTTASKVGEANRATFADLAEAPGTRIPAKIAVLDESDLQDHYEKLLLSLYGKPTNVQFTVRREQMHEPDSVERVIYLTLPAHEYVSACKPYGMELFRYNPRLYLGINRVNSGIAATLRSDPQRHYFHLLNNGVTAVCERFEARDAGSGQFVLHVEDFQVVNGCQTTMTLFSNSAEIARDDKCLIDIKIIQAPGLRDLVSQTTNTQTSILAEDAFANAPEQKKVHDLLRRHDPPYFYAPKRGAWDRERAAQKRTFQDDHAVFGRYRKLTSKELAAVCLAVFGEPEAAKDRPRIVFEKVGGKDSPLYDRIFGVNNVASQWLLPFELLRYANATVKEASSRAKAECPGDPECEQAVRARIGAYGRFRMIHLAYGYLKSATNAAGDFIGQIESGRLLATIDDWGQGLLDIAFDAIVDGYEDASERGESSGLREFFRERKHQPLIQDRFDVQLKRNERQARRTGVSLAALLKLP